MRTIGQHREAVQALVEPALPGGRGDAESVPVVDLAVASGAGRGYRVLAASVPAPTPLPAFDNSQMDGFAVRAADAGTTLRVVAPIPAGLVPPPLQPGTAAPIMTGARIPDGALSLIHI